MGVLTYQTKLQFPAFSHILHICVIIFMNDIAMCGCKIEVEHIYDFTQNR